MIKRLNNEKGQYKTSYIKGDYVYFHYLQDNINDEGWGCAYRTGQTLLSWCRLHNSGFIKGENGYVNWDVPTIEEMQEILFKKSLRINCPRPTSFVGSKEWIGATEVMDL